MLASPSTPTTARVLIADDSPVCRGVLAILLETAGYDVLSVLDGAEALDALRRHDFDLAILDNEMPNLGGVGALTQLREFLPDLPVIVCSGTCTPADELRYRELGIDEVFSKPVDPRRLREKVAQILVRRDNRLNALPIGSSAGNASGAPALGMQAHNDELIACPLVAGSSRFASRLQIDLQRLRDFRSVAILEGRAGSGRFELALGLTPPNAAPGDTLKFVCHADEFTAPHLTALMAPATAGANVTRSVLLVILEADRLNAAQQTLLEELVRERLPSFAFLAKRLRVVLCAQTSLCDLHFNEFVLMRGVTSTFQLPDFKDRWQDWSAIAVKILRRVGTGRGTFHPEALKWIDRHIWTGDYMQLHRTIELARRRAGVITMITSEHLEYAAIAELTCVDPLFHDLLFHVHSGSED